MTLVERIIFNLQNTDGVEGVVVLDGAGQHVGGTGLFGSDGLAAPLSTMSFLVDGASEIIPGATVNIRYRHFSLNLSRGDRFLLGVLHDAYAKPEVVALAARIARRQLERAPEPTAAPVAQAVAPPLAFDDRDEVTQPSFQAPSDLIPRRRAQPPSRDARAEPGSRDGARQSPSQHRPVSSQVRDTARPSGPHTHRESPWAKRAKRPRKRGGGGIWGD